MSGTNPFRRKTTQQSSHLTAAIAPVHHAFENEDRPEPRIPPIDTDIPRSTKAKTGKTVRIISPHSATSDGEYGMPQRFFSPPPIFPSSPPSDSPFPQSTADDSPEDPFSTESDGTGGNVENEATLQNTLKNAGNLQSTTGGVSAMSANPFKRTLARLDTESRPDPPRRDSEGNAMGGGSKTTRPQYDVEDFKKLLLTGENNAFGANTSDPPPVSFQSPAHIGDSSSNTDASSTSRQSFIEPVSGPRQESPRTSHESVLSDDERQRLVDSTPTASDRTKPLTPRHRHGKLVKMSAPQTVSFEDPTLSFTNSVMRDVVSVDRSIPGILGDIDKPLPPIPLPFDVQPPTQNPLGSTEKVPYLESGEPPAGDTAQKRSLPVPPLSRRHSQLKAKPLASDTERSAPIREEAGPESAFLSQSAPTACPNAPPPPPPPRRAGLPRGNSSSSISTAASLVSVSDQSSAADISTRSAKPRPAVPPNRSPSVSSVRRPNQIQTIPGSPAMAPPPPPRRRGSSQSSHTPSRLSGYDPGRLRSDSGASSTSHLAMTPESLSGAENKDVMADLSALQREVDELRGKFKD